MLIFVETFATLSRSSALLRDFPFTGTRLTFRLCPEKATLLPQYGLPRTLWILISVTSFRRSVAQIANPANATSRIPPTTQIRRLTPVYFKTRQPIVHCLINLNMPQLQFAGHITSHFILFNWGNWH